jgi:hypothetical protein
VFFFTVHFSPLFLICSTRHSLRNEFLNYEGALKWQHAEKTLKIYSLPVPTEIPAVYGTEKCIPVPRIAH